MTYIIISLVIVFAIFLFVLGPSMIAQTIDTMEDWKTIIQEIKTKNKKKKR